MKDIKQNQYVLDACCGAKFMWFNKNHPNVIYNDIREMEKGFIKNRQNIEIKPDTNYDFCNLPFPDKRFKLITFDPPQVICKSKTSTLIGCYGSLDKDYDVLFQKGIKELWRVLDDFGILFMKFNNVHINFEEILKHFPQQPLFQTSTNRSKNVLTRWFCFMKIPIAETETQANSTSSSFNMGLEVPTSSPPKSPTATSPNPNIKSLNETKKTKKNKE